MLGIWKNFEEMETNLTLAELESLLEAKRDSDFNDKKFMAALKGVDLDANRSSDTPSFEDIKNRAAAKARGVSQEALEFSQIGIAFEGDN